MIDFGPVTDPLIQLLALALMTLGIWAVRRLASKLGLDAEHELTVMLEGVVSEAVSYGRRRAKQLAAERGEADITDNEMIESAVQYAVNQAPKALARLGVTQDQLRERIKAWLDDD